MKILRASNYSRMPWKNGGGETTEIAVFPEGADLNGFDWRISMATVAADGPFSVFPGIDRTLSILDGAGMVLDIEGRRPITLTAETPPLAFVADAPTSARLVDGTITDLNVMSRRGKVVHHVERIALDGELSFALEAETILFCGSGEIRISDDVLADHDCALWSAGEALSATISGTASCFFISLLRG